MVLRGLALASIMAAAAAAPAGARCALEAGERVHITRVIDGDTVAIEGGEVRLVGIQAPKLALGRPGFAEWPLAPQARARLATLAEGREAVLRYGGARDDRHGRRLAHVFVTGDSGETWLQGGMLEMGLARVYSFPDNRACVADMLALEGAARAAGRGIWSDPHYAPRDAAAVAELESLEGTFQLVEGRVEGVAIVRGRVYLNFDQDYRQDFTVTIDPRDTRRFAERGEALRNLEGETVRVRGWLATINGPMIEATHPEQIELLDAPQSRP